MMRFAAVTAGMISAAAFGTAAHAAEGAPKQAYVHLGLAYLDVEASDVEMTLGGGPVPGAGIGVDPEFTWSVEAGYFITEDVAISLTLNAPVETTNNAGGVLTGAGVLGTDTFGTATLTGHYHWNRNGVVQPYVGGGLAYFFVTDTNDGVVTNLDVEDAFGMAVQVGVDVRMDENWGFFADFKRIKTSVDSSGFFGGPAIAASADLSTTVLQTGLSYAF